LSISDAVWQVRASLLFSRAAFFYAGAVMNVKALLLAGAALAATVAPSLFGNGGAWQTGVPVTGNAAATDQKKTTNVTIEDEKLTIDLHQEFAAVEVRYQMKNTGAKVDQDFFFPLERWAESEDEAGNTLTDLEGYAITADGTELKAEMVDAKGEKPKPEKDKSWGEFKAASRLWKKSTIPFEQGQTREVVIRYRSPYAANRSSVSDDSHSGDFYFRYSLSPAATWKGPIGKGKGTVNYLHPRPEEISIVKPKDRFKKITDTQFAWEFQNLKPTLADDLKIITHLGYDTYPARAYTGTDDDSKFRAEYVIQGKNYFIEHTDYDAVASSTRKPDPAPTPTPAPSPSSEETSAAEPPGPVDYEVANIKGARYGATWAEGVEGDGIGENIVLTSHRPLPLDAITIMPGYKGEDAASWTKNNRVAELEITLNNEHTFSASIPDEKFAEEYPVPVRGYAKPVNTVKLVIKAVHRGTETHDTCISEVKLRGKLAEKPKVQPAR
jgi:hypothetical protein